MMDAWNFRVLVAILVICSFGWIAPQPLCSDFNSQVQQLLKREMLTRDELANLSTVFFDFEKSLRKKWPGTKVIPIGSLTTGLAMKSSDADCVVKVPSYTIYNRTSSEYLVLEAERLLKQMPQSYENVEARFRGKLMSLLIFIYKPTQRNCDVSFINTSGLEISRMVGRYYSLDERALTVARILRLWFVFHKIKLRFTSYTLDLLIIFYLQQQSILPPYYLLKKPSYQPHTLDEWNSVIMPHNSITVYELLGGFYKYYSEFNFTELVLSPFLGRPIPKRDFAQIGSFPEELSLHKEYLNRLHSEPLPVNTTMCVQDVFFSHINVAERVSVKTLAFLKSKFTIARKMFESLSPCDFLTAILTY